MKIIFNAVGKAYEAELCNLFRNRGHDVNCFKDSANAEVISEFVQIKEENVCLMIHISNIKGLSECIKVIRFDFEIGFKK